MNEKHVLLFGSQAQAQAQGTEPVPVTHFQVFGERRTGTNFVSALLARNLEAKPCYHYGWKHGYPSVPAISRHALIVVVIRDPIDWLVSFYSTPFAAMPWLTGLSFSEFIRAEWESEARPKRQQWGLFGHREDLSLKGEVMQLDRHPIEGRRFRNPLEMRKIKLKAHLGLLLRANHAVAVRYEDMAKTPEDVLRAIGERFPVNVAETVRPIDRQVGPKGAPRKLRREDIDSEDLAFIHNELDREDETRFGYLSEAV